MDRRKLRNVIILASFAVGAASQLVLALLYWQSGDGRWWPEQGYFDFVFKIEPVAWRVFLLVTWVGGLVLSIALLAIPSRRR